MTGSPKQHSRELLLIPEIARLLVLLRIRIVVRAKSFERVAAVLVHDHRGETGDSVDAVIVRPWRMVDTIAPPAGSAPFETAELRDETLIVEQLDALAVH